MRIWHEDLIPHLCQKHLCAMWREGLGCWAILTENKKGYRNHPAVREFERCIINLWMRLHHTRMEMLRRGYHPKTMPTYKSSYEPKIIKRDDEWQTKEQQIEVLKTKGCKCNIVQMERRV